MIIFDKDPQAKMWLLLNALNLQIPRFVILNSILFEYEKTFGESLWVSWKPFRVLLFAELHIYSAQHVLCLETFNPLSLAFNLFWISPKMARDQA